MNGKRRSGARLPFLGSDPEPDGTSAWNDPAKGSEHPPACFPKPQNYKNPNFSETPTSPTTGMPLKPPETAQDGVLTPFNDTSSHQPHQTPPLTSPRPEFDVLPSTWCRVPKFDSRAASLANRHYNRRKPGSPQFMPPGETLVLLLPDGDAVFGWWRPHPRSGLKAMNSLDGWTCSIFRNESPRRSSELILEAEAFLHDCGPDGLLTYVWDQKVRSPNPGYCFKMAGYRVRGRSADGRKTLLWKPWTPPA